MKGVYFMEWIIPGTTLVGKREDAYFLENHFQTMFGTGGLVLSQVANLTGLEPYAIQNWVKRGFLTKPEHKRYSMRQVCRILNINMLRAIIPLDDICKLLGYINGALDSESDDLVDDSKLYFMFVRLASRARHIGGTQNWEDALLEVTADYIEPIPGARQKLIEVLRIMLTAWVAGQLRYQVETRMKNL
jgi:DNA-binding transcriptional MerR regulator